MTAGDELTLGEIARSLGRLEEAVAQLAYKVDTAVLKIDVWRVEKAALVETDKRLDERVTAVEKRAADNFRLALTGIIFPIVVGVVVAAILAALR